MTDIGREAQFALAQTQLSVSSYFDEAIFAREQALIFKQSSLYTGHEKHVPEPGDWRTLPHENGGRVLVRGAHGIELMSNVCRHRQAVMLGFNQNGAPASGNLRQTGGNIVCPVHRWTYSVQGELLGAPQFPETPCMNLQRFTLKNCHGLLFEGPRDPAADMAALFERPEFDFSDYVLDHVEIHRCHYNWKTFIEVYLEDYHVEPFHPGLSQFVDCKRLDWQFGDWFSVQIVGANRELKRPGTPVYREWHEQVLKQSNGEVPATAAIWMVYYPNLMIEWYPNVLVVSTVLPRGPEACTNVVEFYFPEEIALFDRDFVEAERKAYLETAAEDEIICDRMTEGRRALLAQGLNEVGPYQSPMEDGMRHFHEFLHRELDRHL